MVVISPSAIPNRSWITLASGAKQLVVHDALDTTSISGLYAVWFTPITNMGVASLGGCTNSNERMAVHPNFSQGDHRLTHAPQR